jgi:nucleoside-diphosphate-sugar epimerase
MNVLLLGSEGTLGKSLQKYLVKQKINVIRWDLKLDINHDLRKQNCIDEILKEVDYVIFLAFDVGGSKYNVNNKEFIDNNMKIILHTFDSLSINKKPFIYTTSCMSNMLTNPYGSLKNISEHYVNLLDGINVKLWNVYGNEEISEKSHVIPDFIHSGFKNKNIKMKTQGNDQRQFIHADDFSEAIFKIMNNHNLFLNWIKENSLKPIDLSSHQWIKIVDLALLVKDIYKLEYNIDIDIITGNESDNHTNKTDPEITIINDYWKPNISLNDGIKKIIMETIEKINDYK